MVREEHVMYIACEDDDVTTVKCGIRGSECPN